MGRQGLCLLLAALAIAACAPIGIRANEDDAKRVRGWEGLGRPASRLPLAPRTQSTPLPLRSVLRSLACTPWHVPGAASSS